MNEFKNLRGYDEDYANCTVSSGRISMTYEQLEQNWSYLIRNDRSGFYRLIDKIDEKYWDARKSRLALCDAIGTYLLQLKIQIADAKTDSYEEEYLSNEFQYASQILKKQFAFMQDDMIHSAPK